MSTPTTALLTKLNKSAVYVIDCIVASMPGTVSFENMMRFVNKNIPKSKCLAMFELKKYSTTSEMPMRRLYLVASKIMSKSEITKTI